MNIKTDDDVLYTVFVKGSDTYIFAYRPTQVSKVFNTLGRFAANPDLSLTIEDAARVSLEIHRRVLHDVES